MSNIEVFAGAARASQSLFRKKMHNSSDLAHSAAEGSMQPEMLQGWDVESLRLSFLGVTEWVQRPIFREIADAQPGLITSQPLVQLHQEAGDLSLGHLNISQQANRVDVVLSDSPTRNTYDQTAPGYKPLFSIGPYKHSMEMFEAISNRTTSLVRSAARVAYAVTLIRQTESVREAVNCLHKCLPTVAIDPNKDLDLIFQINRPSQDKQGRLINRLAKWESLRITTLHVGIGAAPFPAVPSVPPMFAARVYLDISTDAENTEPLSDLSEIVGELRAHAAGIAENGDTT